VTTVQGPFTDKANAKVAEQRYIELGLAYIQRQQFEHARKSLDRAKQINSDSYGAYAAMGLLYQQEEEYKLADEQFRKALDINENYTRGRTWYAAFLYSRHRYEEALRNFQKASEDTEYDSRSQVFINIGHTAEKLKRYDLAKKAYLKVFALDPSSSRPLVELIDLEIKRGQFDEARKYYRKLQEIIRSGTAKHSLKTLEQGFIIAHHFKDHDGQTSFLLLMKNLYPNSNDYKKYKAMLSND
jgi:type IV pilus assembly protein PilF